jgi:hypothetical protein
MQSYKHAAGQLDTWLANCSQRMEGVEQRWQYKAGLNTSRYSPDMDRKMGETMRKSSNNTNVIQNLDL